MTLMTRRHIELTQEQLRALYIEEQLTPKMIGQRLGCSESTIRNSLVKHGITTRTISEQRRIRFGTNRLTQDLLDDLYNGQRLSQEEIGKELDLSIATISRKMDEFGLEVRSFADASLVYPRRDFDETLCAKAYLVGFRLGDLRVAIPKKGGLSETIRIETSSTKPEQIELVKQLFDRYGRVWIGQPRGKDHKRVDIVCHVNLSFSFLLPKVDRIEDWIRASDDTMAAFVAGYVDAEGSFKLNKGDAQLALDSYDKGIQQHIFQWFTSQGIQCPAPHIVKPKGSKNTGNSVYRKDIWRLAVYRKRSMERLAVLIGPYMKHRQRKQDMQLAIENIRERDKRHGKY